MHISQKVSLLYWWREPFNGEGGCDHSFVHACLPIFELQTTGAKD
jgi:hypothetical protein